jgi:hypothetical protein
MSDARVCVYDMLMKNPTLTGGIMKQIRVKAVLIPVHDPIREMDLPTGDQRHLKALQNLVGGHIEAIGVPVQFTREAHATCYIHEEGKYVYRGEVNYRATDFLCPGIGLFMGDYIAGPMVVCGFDPTTGANTDIPDRVMARIQLISIEAGY